MTSNQTTPSSTLIGFHIPYNLALHELILEPIPEEYCIPSVEESLDEMLKFPEADQQRMMLLASLLFARVTTDRLCAGYEASQSTMMTYAHCLWSARIAETG